MRQVLPANAMRCSRNLAAARDCGEPSGKSAGLGSVWPLGSAILLMAFASRPRTGTASASNVFKRSPTNAGIKSLGLLAARDGCARSWKRGVSDVALFKRLRNIEEWLRGLSSLAPSKSP